MADILRRVQGDAVAAFGLGSSECPHRIVASGPYWRLRDYGRHEAPQSLLIVAAPIKRPYIWDLAPSASAIGYCLQKGLHVHLLEWVPASRRASNTGLDECARAISDCVAKVWPGGPMGYFPSTSSRCSALFAYGYRQAFGSKRISALGEGDAQAYFHVPTPTEATSRLRAPRPTCRNCLQPPALI
jgi:hypothetical protein